MDIDEEHIRREEEAKKMHIAIRKSIGKLLSEIRSKEDLTRDPSDILNLLKEVSEKFIHLAINISECLNRAGITSEEDVDSIISAICELIEPRKSQGLKELGLEFKKFSAKERVLKKTPEVLTYNADTLVTNPFTYNSCPCFSKDSSLFYDIKYPETSSAITYHICYPVATITTHTHVNNRT